MPRDTSRKVSQNSAWVPELTNTVDARNPAPSGRCIYNPVNNGFNRV